MWVIETTFPFVYRNPTGGVINSVDMRLLHNTMALFIITLTMKTFSLAQARTQWFHILDLAQSGKRIKLVNDHTNRSYILELLPTESAKVMPAPNRTLFQRHSTDRLIKDRLNNAMLDLQKRVTHIEQHLNLTSTTKQSS